MYICGDHVGLIWMSHLLKFFFYKAEIPKILNIIIER